MFKTHMDGNITIIHQQYNYTVKCCYRNQFRSWTFNFAPIPRRLPETECPKTELLVPLAQTILGFKGYTFFKYKMVQASKKYIYTRIWDVRFVYQRLKLVQNKNVPEADVFGFRHSTVQIQVHKCCPREGHAFYFVSIKVSVRYMQQVSEMWTCEEFRHIYLYNCQRELRQLWMNVKIN